MEKRFSPVILTYISLFFLQISFFNLNAKLDFTSPGTSIVLKSSDSALKFSSVDNIYGWRAQQIISAPLDDKAFLYDDMTWGHASSNVNPVKNGFEFVGDLTIPDNQTITINQNRIIDGQGHTLNFGNNAQILIDSNISVTLKNLTFKNSTNDTAIPPIKCLDLLSKLTLENVKFALNDDFIFKTGQMYLQNDVIFTGTSKFIYQSVLPSYIQPHSQLYFDKDTIFDYSPNSINKDLIVMADKTSSIYLDGCALQTTDTGIKLTKGQLFFDNKTTLSNSCIYSLTSLSTTITSKLFGTRANCVNWSPDGKYLAACGVNHPTDLIVYEWNGSTLTQKDTKDFGSEAKSVAWSPNGKYLAVGGNYSSTDLIIYEWNGSTLTQKDTKAFGTSADAVAWSPNGKYLAVGGNNSSTDLIIYEWNGSTLTQKDTKDFGIGAFSVAWSPNGKYLAVGGNNSSTDLIIYEWNGSTLTQKDTKDLGIRTNSVDWSPSGKYLAVGGLNNPNDLVIYEWNGSTLTQKDTKDFGTYARCVNWSHNGKYLAVSGSNNPTDLIVYEWNNSSLSIVVSEIFGGEIYSVAWDPDDKNLAIGGNNGSNYVVEIKRANYNFIENHPTFNNSIIFGDFEKGSDYDLDINILSGAQVILDGVSWFDNSTTSSRKMDFASIGSSIVLSGTSSKFKITNSENISGWKEESIVSESGNDNSWIPGDITYGHLAPETPPPARLLYHNSNAIINLKENSTENSNSIVNISENVNENSSAIVTNRTDIDTNDNDINYNSQAIVTNRADIDSNDTDIAALQADVAENSSAIVVNRNDIDTNTNNINYNSQAIVTNKNDIDTNTNSILYNSNAIVNIESDLAIQNSNAIINLQEDVTENSNAIVNTSEAILSSRIDQNSWAILTLRDDVIENSSVIVTNRSDIDTNDNDINYNSQAIVTNRADIDSNDTDIAALQADVAENSSAIVVNRNDIDTNTNNINYNSQAIVTNKNDIDTNTNSILYNSNAIVNIESDLAIQNSNAIINLQEDVTENSNAIVNTSEAILSSRIDQNSWAILTLRDDVIENSSVIVTNRSDIDTNDNDINYNSQAIVTNRADIDSNDTDIAALQADVAENSSAIVVNRNDIDTNTNNINYNSQAIVTNRTDIDTNTNNILYNSNAIVNIESDLAIQNSNAIINLEEDISENSSALITCCENANDLIQQNSMAIVLNRSIIDLHDNTIEQNSEAIISNAINISNLEEDVTENSNAIINIESDLAIQNSNAIVNLEEDITENSMAIVTNRSDIDTNTDNILYNSNAIVNIESDLAIQNSNAIVNLEEDITENSNAIVNIENDLAIQNSNAIINLEEDVIENSNAITNNNEEINNNSNALITCCDNANNSITENSNAIINLQEDIHENSQAIIFIREAGTNLIVENSNAIVNNSSFIAQALITQNSDAIVSIDNFPLVDGPLTTDITLEKSAFIHPTQRIFVAGNITINGQGATLYFATDERPIGAQFVIDEYKTLILKNIRLAGLTHTTFEFRKGSRLIIGENVSWEFFRNITLSSGNIILQNQVAADGSDIANSFYIRGIGGKKRLTLTPDSDTTLPMINLGQNTLALQNIEFTGLEYISQTISPDGLLIGALGLAGDAAVNIEQSNNMAFAVMGLGNTFRMLENNLTFNGQLDFVGLGEDVLHLDFVLRSPVESVNAGTQLSDGKVPVINFGTGFIYLTSLSGVARIIFDDYLIRINNAANAFIVTNNGYLGANKLYVSGDPIWDASNDSSKNRFAVEANEIEAVKALGKEYKKQLPDFGIPIIVDPYHPHRTSDFRSVDDDTDLIKTLKENIRPKTALQLERAKEENIDPSTIYFSEPNFIIKN